jgi:hypothetical protein
MSEPTITSMVESIGEAIETEPTQSKPIQVERRPRKARTETNTNHQGDILSAVNALLRRFESIGLTQADCVVLVANEANLTTPGAKPPSWKRKKEIVAEVLGQALILARKK